MKRLLIKNGILIDSHNGLHQVQKDIAVESGIITRIEEHLDLADYEVVDMQGQYVCAGMIDVHVHNNMADPNLILDTVDHLGVWRGVTTVIECGSVSVNEIDHFAQLSKEAKTRYFGLLSGHGLEGFGKAGSQDPDLLDPEQYQNAVKKHSGLIVGLKVACSNTITNDQGYALVKKSREICDRLGLPLTIHVGNFPPDPCGLVEFLKAGDVVTHTYHGKEISLFLPDGTPKKSFQQARKRGVLFDVGHGSASFSWTVYDKARRKGFTPDLISTDIRRVNQAGPVYSLAVVLSKMMNLQMSLEEVIAACTTSAAKAYHLQGLGELKVGAKGDFTCFKIEEKEIELVDCYHQWQPIRCWINPTHTIVSKGEQSELYCCNEGKLEH